ncbi:MAG: ATP-binding cassette domain-containing protein [Cellulosilyticum sp.]|nr:ATP-binding cassette domain-containing protein [Cellulosilyticum sp.]
MKYCIEVNHLNKRFGNVDAVKDLSFKVEQGELFGFLGINGAGKSTTINMICTLLQPTSGEIKVSGHLIGKDNQEIRKKIGVVFQGNTLDDELTVYENLLARAYLYEKDSKKVKQHITEISEVLDIKALYNRPFRALSGGQKRKCEIAKALLHNPEILFLDEPTTGLDPQTRKIVWESIEDLRKATGMTVFLTTHYMEEAVRANHIAVMDAGEMVAFDTPYKLKENYAKDTIKIATKEYDKVTSILEKDCHQYKMIENRIHIEVANTLESISLLEKMKQYMEAFEVVQGTMEDAFLNITNKSLTEV